MASLKFNLRVFSFKEKIKFILTQKSLKEIKISVKIRCKKVLQTVRSRQEVAVEGLVLFEGRLFKLLFIYFN